MEGLRDNGSRFVLNHEGHEYSPTVNMNLFFKIKLMGKVLQ
jgi:hypothetical protein